MVPGTEQFHLTRLGLKAFAVRQLAKRGDTDLVDAALARYLGTSSSALQSAEDTFKEQKKELYAVLKLAQVGGLLDEMATEERRQSRTQWLADFPLLIKNGFYPWQPPTGYRRPSPGELSGESVRNIRISPELAVKLADDPELEKLLRKFQLRRDDKVADNLRDVLVLIIKENRLPLQAAREKSLSIKKTTFLALLKNPILHGMIVYKGELHRAILGPDKPISSKEEYDLLQQRLQQQKESKHSSRVIDVVSALQKSKLTFTQIAQTTHRDRSTLSRAIRELKQAGRIDKEKGHRGRYFLRS